MISFTLFLTPVAKGRPKFDRRGFAYTPAKTREFEKQVTLMARAHAPKIIFDGPVCLQVKFFMPLPTRPRNKDFPIVRPDLDNLLKSLTDALHFFWKDDSQIVEIKSRKLYDYTDKRPRIEVKCFEVTEK